MKTRMITAVIGIAVGISVLVFHNTLLYPLFVALISALSVHEILTVCGCGSKKFPVHYGMCLLFATVINNEYGLCSGALCMKRAYYHSNVRLLNRTITESERGNFFKKFC